MTKRRGGNRMAVAIGLAVILGLSLIGAAAAGAFATTARSVRTSGSSHRPERLATSCTTVRHIGDSTSVGMIAPDYLPDPAQRLAAQYADVGVRRLWVDASGGRSIVEVMPGQINGYNVARNWNTAGFRGCWSSPWAPTTPPTCPSAPTSAGWPGSRR